MISFNLPTHRKIISAQRPTILILNQYHLAISEILKQFVNFKKFKIFTVLIRSNCSRPDLMAVDNVITHLFFNLDTLKMFGAYSTFVDSTFRIKIPLLNFFKFSATRAFSVFPKNDKKNFSSLQATCSACIHYL